MDEKVTLTKEQLFKVIQLNEVEKKSNEDNQNKNDLNFTNMVSSLLNSQTQAHVFHLQSKSYSEHKSLQKYYEGIDSIVDGIIESYQGKYGIINEYDSIKIEKYESSEQIISYFEKLDEIIEIGRKKIKESYIQNQIDTAQELIYSTIYKLKHLK